MFVLAVAPVAFAEPAHIYRCIGEHGEISFSATRCADAAEIVLPDEAAPSRSRARAPSALESARTKDTCPASPEALRDVIAEAFARRDANTLAGVMRWDGVGSGAATSRMRELADLTAQPLLGIDIDAGYAPPPYEEDAPFGPEESAPPRAREETDSALLVVHTGSLGGGESEHEFRLTPDSGCYWLDW